VAAYHNDMDADVDIHFSIVGHLLMGQFRSWAIY
jgi:hypothetical protein